MQIVEARVTELRSDETGSNTLAWISCPSYAIPAPGRYVMAWAIRETQAPLPAVLFAAEISGTGFLAAPPVPSSWRPGDVLRLHGPLGNGFEMPSTLHRLALASVGADIYRLLPLIRLALAQDAAVALYCDHPITSLPLAVEVNPLTALPDGLAWADFLGLALSISRLVDLRGLLGLHPDASSSGVTGQALISVPMPCGGMAECGACALQNGKRWKLTCVDGPVFELRNLLRRQS